MRSVRLCVLVLGLLVGREIAEAAEPAGGLSPQSDPSGGERRPERRTIGRLGAGVQLGGFFDLGDPAIEVRGWAKRMGLSLSLGRHSADPSEPDASDHYPVVSDVTLPGSAVGIGRKEPTLPEAVEGQDGAEIEPEDEAGAPPPM